MDRINRLIGSQNIKVNHTYMFRFGDTSQEGLCQVIP